MNCCDYNCNQGRECPARVAKVRQRYPAADPLPTSNLPKQMRYLAKWFLVCLAALLLAILVLVFL